MLLCDVNILVYAHREDADNHIHYRSWLEEVLAGDMAFGVAPLVLSGFLRIVTHPAIFRIPTPLEEALSFTNILRDHPAAVSITPGPRHWQIFDRLCRTSNATGNLIPDAWLAALAIEHGCEWITTDRDYKRFAGLRHRRPF